MSRFDFTFLYTVADVEVETQAGSRCVKAAIVVFTCDLPARALLLNMRQFNGASSCHLCEDVGKTSPDNPLFRWWPYGTTSVLRSKQSLIDAAVKATGQNEAVSIL